MTRGYIVIIDGKKIVRMLYSNSDSYFTTNEDLTAGVVLKAMASDDFINTLNTLAKKELERGYFEEVTDFEPEDKFYIRTTNSKENFFVDYVYEYNVRNKKLTIYRFGRKMLQFTKDDIEYMAYIFSNSNDFFSAFALDEKTCKYDSKLWVKAFKSFMKERIPIAEIENKVKELVKKNRVVVEIGNIVDYSKNGFKKQVVIYDEQGNRQFEHYFCFSSFFKDGDYEMAIQLPYCRVSLISTKRNGYRVSYYSRHGIQKAFLEYIKNPLVQKELINAVPLFEIYRKFAEEFKGILKSAEAMNDNKEEKIKFLEDKRNDTTARFMEELTPFKELTFSNMMCGRGHFSVDCLEREFASKWDNVFWRIRD